jgi:hypothetical protein
MPQQEARRPAFFRGQLKFAGACEVDVADLADHGGKPLAFEGFFHGPEEVLLFGKVDKDYLMRVDAKPF